MSSVLDELERNGNIKIEKGDNFYMKLGINQIPEIILDNIDRNRTSLFAFAGNKFEFISVGGDANFSNSMTVLNSIFADQLLDFNKKLINKIDARDEKRLSAIEILNDYIKVSQKIRFEGDSYSLDWEKGAEKRGLSNVRDTPRALDFLTIKKSKDLFRRYGVLNETEILARHQIMLEN